MAELPAPEGRASGAPSRLKRFSAILLGVALLLGGLYLAGQTVVNRYLQSDDLRRRVSQQAATGMDGRAGLLPLSWRGVAVYSEGLLVQGKPGQSFTELRAQHLTARCDPRALWEKKIRVEQLTVQHLQAAFGATAAKHLVEELRQAPQLLEPTGSDSPLTVDVRELSVDRTDLFWGNPGDDGGYLREVRSQFWPDGKNLFVQGEGGMFRQGRWPQAKVGQFQLYYEKPRLRIDTGSLTLGGESRVDVEGVFEFTTPGKMDLHLHFQRCPVDPFLEAEMRSKLEGTFESRTEVSKELGKESVASVKGTISVAGGVLRNVPALEKVALFTGEPRFKNLRLRALKGSFARQGAKMKIEQVIAEAVGLFRAEGECRLDGKRLSGTLQLGVTEAVLKSFPGAREEVFTKAHDGFFWTAVQLSGTTDDPREDLKQRLIAAAKKHFSRMLLAPILKPGESIVEQIEKLF